MNRERAKLVSDNRDVLHGLASDGVISLDFNLANIALIEAFADGKTIELKMSDGWRATENPTFTAERERYRIAPEPRYVEYGVEDLARLVDQNKVITRGRTHSKCERITYRGDGVWWVTAYMSTVGRKTFRQQSFSWGGPTPTARHDKLVTE